MITIVGMVERESGVTPPPPVITVNMGSVVLLGMFVVGLLFVLLVLPLLQ